MRQEFSVVIERDSEGRLQGESLDELQENLREVIAMLMEDGEPALEVEYIGTQLVTV